MSFKHGSAVFLLMHDKCQFKEIRTLFFKAKELLRYCSEEEMHTHQLPLYFNLLFDVFILYSNMNVGL